VALVVLVQKLGVKHDVPGDLSYVKHTCFYKIFVLACRMFICCLQDFCLFS
jgi:hypothetical protein